MPSPVFNAFGNRPQGGGQPNNFMQMMQKFNEFRRTFSGDPKQQVEQLLQNGQMSKEQFEQCQQMANQFAQFFK